MSVRAGAFLQPIRIAGLVLVTLFLFGMSAAIAPDAPRASLDGPLTHDCDLDGGWYCELSVTVQGSGRVTSDDQDINCPGSCQQTYFWTEIAPFVTLTATPDPGWHLSSWIGCDSASGSTCTVEMNHDRAVTALFELTTYRLTVTLAGTGSGSVAGGGISCPGTCAVDVAPGTTVRLTETPSSGSTWGGWSGDCSGTATTCSVTMNADRNVTATFTAVRPVLRVTAPTGGKVTGSGIDCPTDCEQPYDAGTTVQLTAVPNSGMTFASWGGDCSGTATTCNVLMDKDRNVTATFTAVAKPTLRVTPPTGGKVTGSGIDCPTDCEQTYDAGTSVQLTAVPNAGMTFTGWGGDCSGTAPTCNVVMDRDRNVTATFAAVAKPILRVSAPAGGKVTGSGIDCPTDCEQTYDSGASVQLTAVPDTGMSFTGWGGDCSGAATTCTLTMDRDRSVTATFGGGGGGGGGLEYRQLNVTVNGANGGTVKGPGINCPGDCTESFLAGTQVTLNAAPAAKFEHTWGGDCAGAGVAASCSLAMTVARSVVATFKPTATVQGAEMIDGGHDEPGTTKLAPNLEEVITLIAGSGSVTSSGVVLQTAGATAPRRINCGTTGSGALRFDCYGEYRPGEALTLTATPAPGYAFKRWTGACAGSKATCRVVIKDARTTTAVFEATGRGAAVAATLRRPRLRVRWQSSVGAGNLVVEGSTSLPAAARVDVRRPGGGPLATLKLKLQGGKFRQTLPLRRGALSGGAKLFPGGFTVALTGRSGRLKLPLQMQTIAISSPAEGVVRKAFKSASENGREVVRFPAGATEAWANFRFETQPRMNQRLTVRWYWPDGKQLGEVRKNNRPVISSYLRLATGLPSGLWVAELRAGKRVIHRLSVRIG